MEFNLNNFKERALTIDSIGLLYILVVGVLCHILPIPEIVKGFLALLGFLIIPYLVGKTISIPIKRFLSIEFDSFDIFRNFILCWCIGLISIVMIAYFLNYLWLFDAKIYTIIVLLMCIPTVFYRKESQHVNLKRFMRQHGGTIAIFLSILIGVSGFMLVTYFTPYPYEAGGDSIDHHYYSMQIYEENFFSFIFAYPLLSIHLLSAINIQIFNMYNEPYILWWLARLILYIVYSLGLYLFSYRLSKNKTIALISVIVGVFVVHHNSGLIYLNDFAPKAFILVLFPYFLIFIHNLAVQKINADTFEIKRLFGVFSLIVALFGFLALFLYYTYNPSGFSFVDSIGFILPFFIIFVLIFMKYVFKDRLDREISLSLFVIMLVLLLVHIPMGAFCFLFVSLYFAFSIFIKKYPKITNLTVYLMVVFAVLFFLLQTFEIMNFPSPLLSFYGVIDPSLDGFKNTFTILNDIYSLAVLYFFLIGATLVIFYNKKEYFPELFLVSIISIFLFAPIGTMYRIIVFFNPLMAYLAAYGLFETAKLISEKRKKFPISIGFLFMIIVFAGITNSMDEIDIVVSKQGVFSYALGSEIYSTGNFLKDNTPKDTLLLYYESNWNTLRIGHYSLRMTYSPMSKSEQPPECVKEIFTVRTSKESYDKVKDLLKNEGHECEYYLGDGSQYQYTHRQNKVKQLINNRKSKDISFVIILDRGTLDVLPPNTINKFYNTSYFTPLYNDTENEIYIFGVNPEPGVPFELINNSKS